MTIFRVVTVCALTATWLGQSTRGQSGSDGLLFDSYRAHVAAAHASIRLNELSDANEWLQNAPQGYRDLEWTYLHSLLNQHEAAHSASAEDLSSIDVTDDGTKAVTAGADGLVRVWSIPDWRLLIEIPGHGESVYRAAFSRDGARLITVSRDMTSRVWDSSTGVEIARIQLPNPAVAAATFSPDGSAAATCAWTRDAESGSVCGMVWIWNPLDGEVLHERRVGAKPLSSIQYTPDGSKILTCSWDGIIHVLDSTGAPVRDLSLPDEGVYNAANRLDISPDGSLVAAASKDHTVRIFEIDTGKLLATLRGHDDDVMDVAFSPNGALIATASHDLSIRIWDRSSYAMKSMCRGHQSQIGCLAWLPDSSALVSGDHSGSVFLWDSSATHDGTTVFDLATSGTYSCEFSPDCRRMYVACYDGRVLVIDAASGAQVHEWIAHPESSCNTLSLSADGSRLLTCSWDKSAKLWSLPDGKLVQTLSASGGIHPCELSADGSRALLAIGDTLEVWNAAEGVLIHRCAGHTSAIADTALSHDGAVAATASSDGMVKIWNVMTGECVQSITLADASPRSVDFGPDGRTLATGVSSGAIQLWNSESGELIRALKPSGGSAVIRLAWHPDGTRIAAAAEKVFLVDAQFGGVVLGLKPNPDSVWALRFSPDGKSLATCAATGTLAVTRSERDGQ